MRKVACARASGKTPRGMHARKEKSVSLRLHTCLFKRATSFTRVRRSHFSRVGRLQGEISGSTGRPQICV